MNIESRKFLDLDHLCESILSGDDREMFAEAISCYQIGSHRAAVILAWCATADCLDRRVNELAEENDGTAQSSRSHLNQHRGKATFEEQLIIKALECNLVDEYDAKCLRFARDTRSKCAHPSGVVPSAESVRNIFHICSQTVLSRRGYRGIAFIEDFVRNKLNDRHVFSDSNRISETCKYYIDRVPERIRTQFSRCVAENISTGTSEIWKGNLITFLRELILTSSEDKAQKICQCLQGVEPKDRNLYSIIVGIDIRPDLFDEPIAQSAKSHLLEAISSRTGRPDSNQFGSYVNLCARFGLDALDVTLILSKFETFSKFFIEDKNFITIRGKQLLDIVFENFDDETHQRRILNGLDLITRCPIFLEYPEEGGRLVDLLIASDWNNEPVRAIFRQSPNWHNSLKICLLEKSKDYLSECSEDHIDEISQIFDVADSILRETPVNIPPTFEQIVLNVLNKEITFSWTEEEGEAMSSFIRGACLIKSLHSSHLELLGAFDIPPKMVDEDDA